MSGIASITQTGKTGSLSINLHCPLVEHTQSLLLMLHRTYFFNSCKITLVNPPPPPPTPKPVFIKSLNVIIKMLFFPDFTESVKINRGVFTSIQGSYSQRNSSRMGLTLSCDCRGEVLAGSYKLWR